PAELKAEKPEDVKTVVWLEYDEDKIDEFDDGAAAYVWTVKVSVIDKERGRMVGQQDFRGGDPPMTKTYSGAAYGPRPNKEGVDYLMALPRQCPGVAGASLRGPAIKAAPPDRPWPDTGRRSGGLALCRPGFYNKGQGGAHDHNQSPLRWPRVHPGTARGPAGGVRGRTRDHAPEPAPVPLAGLAD